MRLASSECEAVFHVAAVSDFAFGGLWERTDAGLRPWPTKPGKIPTSAAHLLLELRPTPKLLDHLPAWFPRARIVGWKLEVDGDQVAALAKASEQIQRCGTHACVANGPAYGPGFGLVTAPGHCRHCPDPATLYQALAELIRQQERSVGG
jgi:phosphopantothenoylcysteine decarboxylase/phosphopantothenate--cysteine ligase